jgi:NadR type nicotinamide-nucleotide adenylyltransferase
MAHRSARPVVVVTGSECTGKTTLAAELGAQFGGPVSLEFAREYLTGRTDPLDASDVDPIARGQLRAQEDADEAAARRQAAIVIRDTDLLSTVVYSHHYYGGCPAWVEREARDGAGDLYLLLVPDVPWVADGLLRDRPEGRNAMHDLFRTGLADAGVSVIEIGGTWDERRARAVSAVEDLLASKKSPQVGTGRVDY